MTAVGQLAFATTLKPAVVNGKTSRDATDMSHQQQINKKFDQNFAACYSDKVQATVPGYNFLHDMAAALIGANVADDANVLIAGPGIGKELITLGNRFKQWRLTAFDPSPDMLELSRQAMIRHGLDGRVTLVQGTVDTVQTGEPFDAAIAVLVMHFLPDDGPKAGFLNGLCTHLKTGAPLILADMHGQRGQAATEHLYQCWKRYLQQIHYDAGTVDNELSMLHFVSEHRIIELLSEAGFDGIAEFYRAFLFGGWFARKH